MIHWYRADARKKSEEEIKRYTKDDLCLWNDLVCVCNQVETHTESAFYRTSLPHLHFCATDENTTKSKLKRGNSGGGIVCGSDAER